MNPVEKMSIGGYAFTIETAAVETIGQYLSELKSYYDSITGGNEVMEGIEERMAELLLERSGISGVVTITDALSVINTLGKPETIESESDMDDSSDKGPDDAAYNRCKDRKTSADSKKKKLYRDIDNGKILGVCSGLSNYFNIDTVAVRVIFVLLGATYWALMVDHNPFFALVMPIMTYFVLGFITPAAKTVNERHRMKGEGSTVNDIQRVVQNSINEASETIRSIGNSDTVRTGSRVLLKIFGILLLLIGFSGLFTESLVLFWNNIFGFESLTTDFMHRMLLYEPRLYTAFSLIWVQCVIALACSLPFILLIYAGLQLIIGFKSPKWNPGLIIFILWLLSLIMIFVIAFLASSTFD